MKKILTILLILIVLMNSSLVYAQGGTVNKDSPGGNVNTPPAKKTTPIQKLVPIDNPLNAKSVEDVIILFVDIAIYVGVAMAILVLIFIGFKFVLAQGNSDKISEARKWFMWAIIGLAVLISSKVIVEIIKNTLISAGVAKEEYFKKR